MAETDAQRALLESALRLSPIPADAARAYDAALPILVHGVNARVGAHSRYRDWLGGNLPQLLSDNHSHHGLFMSEILSTGQFDLLALTLPWVYHSYHTHGVAYDYFPAELGYWKQQVSEALPGEGAASIIAVYDWMIARHEQVVDLAERRGEPEDGVDPTLIGLFEPLLQALRSFDDDRVLDILRVARDAGISLPETLEELVFPAMTRIGQLWENNEITAADEHEATAIMNRVLANLYFDESFPAQQQGLALVAASAQELHEMGAWMVATCLELAGWDVDYLGANVPEKDLVAKAVETGPQLVALSVSMPFNLGHARSTISALRTQLPDTRVMIGGQVFQWLPRLADTMGADVCLASCQEAVRWANAHAAAGAGTGGNEGD